MASHSNQMAYQQAPSRHHPQASYGSSSIPVAPGVSSAPAGTFSPGTKIQVGGHRVLIIKYLSEGGFAHVYLVKLPKPVDGTDQAVLKRVAVPDKEALRSMRTEVETMKRLKGHRPIVTYIDSHASELKGGGYEVFLLMEYCNGGGLIDFMNTRLQHRLTEPEILDIFADIAEGVACMHYLKPPLLHRDLKVENVLITSRGGTKRFKVCDFGSATVPRPAPTTVVECRLMDEDIQKHTTLQYRSPEMIDVYRKQPMNEKCDIWALGVLLYKLCYYTTPFEDQGQLAILNASYKFPALPVFSDRLKRLIGSMLKESMQARPTIYQALKEACLMQGREVPIHDIYSGRSSSAPGRGESRTPTQHKDKSGPVLGAVYSPEPEAKPSIPNVVPMRRGRPAASPGPAQQAPRPSPSPKVTGGDPFAALDSKSARRADPDDVSSRFPSLDQFSLLHDSGSKFDFDSSLPKARQQPGGAELKQRVADKLADEAFASPRGSPPIANLPSRPKSVNPPASPAMGAAPGTVKASVGRAQSIISSNPDLRAISSSSTSRYVSTGTMTTDSPKESSARSAQEFSKPAGFGQPLDHTISARRSAEMRPSSSMLYQQNSASSRDLPSKASLDVNRSQPDHIETTLRTSMSASRSRPVSGNFESSTLDFLREKETSRPSSWIAKQSPRNSPSLIALGDSDDYIGSDMDSFDVDIRDPGSSNKRSSLSSLSNSKSILAGKFGDAFKRFEASNSDSQKDNKSSSLPKDAHRQVLTPISGSVATDGRSDDGRMLDDEESITPEMRREMERTQLEEEEQRVEAAQAEYRRRKAEEANGFSSGAPPRSVGGVPRAISIQNRVQGLLNEQQRPATVTRTAEGYGKYSDAASAASKSEKQSPAIPRKPVTVAQTKFTGTTQTKSPVANLVGSTPARSMTGPAASPLPMSSKPTGKPAAPKKPTHLNSLPTGGRPVSPSKPSQPPPSQELLMAEGLPGQPVLEMSSQAKDDYLENFSKRFPSLSSMEMVGRDNGSARR